MITELTFCRELTVFNTNVLRIDVTYQSLPEGVDPATALDPGQYLLHSVARALCVCKEDKAHGLAQPCGLYSLTDICIMGAD